MDYKLKYINTIARATHVPVEKLGENSLMLWAAYKQCANRTCIDIDVTKEAVLGYAHSYEYLKDGLIRQQNGYPRKFEVLRNGEAYRGDTMTSFGNIVRAYYMLRDGLNNIGISKCIEKIFEENGEVDLRLIRLAGLIHTPGNLIPVPLKFNRERSGTFARMDYWDTTLYYLHKYMTTDDDKWLDELLDSRDEPNDHLDESVYLTETWLDNFDNDWETFLVKNHLEMYVDNNLRPVELWEGHLSKNWSLKRLDEVSFWQVVTRLSGLIEQRNAEIEERHIDF